MNAAADNVLGLNLQRIVVFRVLIWLVQLCMVLAAVYGFDLHLPLPILLTVLGAYAAFNIWTALRLRRHRAHDDTELFLQLVVDVAALSVLLYFTGGATNPFVSFYVLPLIVAASMLSARYTWAMAALTVGAYSLLMFVYVPLPHAHDFRWHLYGMWAGFFVAAALIAYVVLQIRKALSQHEALLAQAREDAMRNERIVSLATLAAGAAHELGTPLSTMAIVVNELRADAAPGLGERLEILREQIQRCKRTLGTLATAAGAAKAQGGRALALDVYIEELLQQWRRLHLDLQVRTQWNGTRPAPTILADETLSQAFTIVLNNAADVSPNDIEVLGRWDEQTLEFEVCDRGPGIAPQVAAMLGRTPYSTKGDEHGLGVGLVLAHTTIQRLGGEVQVHNRDGGGCRTHIRLPLAPLRA